MEFRILGPVEASSEGHPLQLGGARQRALLAYLLLHPGEVVSADRLLDQLWTEPPRGGAAAVQTQVSRLRKVLRERITTSGHGYALHIEPGELDLDQFRALLANAGATHDPVQRAHLLREADRLWRGEALGGVDAPFAAAEAAALEELRFGAIEDRIEADLERGLNREVVSELPALVAQHPLRERLRGQQILALYRTGRQADALEAYRMTRLTLDEELGLEPSPALRELERAILRHDPALAAPATDTPDLPAPGPGPEARKGLRIVVVAGLSAALVAAGAVVAVLIATGDTRQASTRLQPAKVVRKQQHARPLVKHRAETHQGRSRIKQVQTVKRHPPLVATAPTSKTETTTVQLAKATDTGPVSRATTPPTHTTTTRRPAAPQPKPMRLSDTFGGNQIDGTIWYQIYQGSGWTLTQSHGSLEFTFSTGSAPGGQYNVFGGHVGTRCKFPGDFDARVDFTLTQWPAVNGVRAVLWAFFGPTNIGWQTWRWSSPQGNELYGSYTGLGQSAGVPLSDPAGTLRIARTKGVVTTYFLHNGGWQPLTSGHMDDLATIAVGADGGPGDNSPFGGQQVVVDFDNFTVTGPNPVCPPGSQPHAAS